ncbi:radical SAM protein [bacterium]|nr:MAG: radical SAM protein [bacterium]
MLLINPDCKVNKDIPNIGLAYIATYFGAKVIDLNTSLKPRNRFLRQQSDLLGISVQSRCYREASRIAGLYQARYPNAQVKSVSGILSVQCCYPYLKLADDLYVNQEFSDALSFPNYELFDSFGLFLKNWQKDKWRYALMTSRGCPYLCLYCAARNSHWQARSAQNCYKEIKSAQKKWGIKSFLIIDDCFNIDRQRVMEFCDLIRPLGLSWSCANGLRADRFDAQLARKMKDSGCDYVGFGIESIDPKVLEAVNKGESIGQIEDALENAKRYFKQINGYFIIGLPKSTYEKDINSLKWARERQINAFFSYYIPPDSMLDRLFYGPQARAVSREYPARLQEEIYALTKSMRPKEDSEYLFKGLLDNIRLFWKKEF